MAAKSLNNFCETCHAIFSSKNCKSLKDGLLEHLDRAGLAQNRHQCEFCRFLFQRTPETSGSTKWLLNVVYNLVAPRNNRSLNGTWGPKLGNEYGRYRHGREQFPCQPLDGADSVSQDPPVFKDTEIMALLAMLGHGGNGVELEFRTVTEDDSTNPYVRQRPAITNFDGLEAYAKASQSIRQCMYVCPTCTSCGLSKCIPRCSCTGDSSVDSSAQSCESCGRCQKQPCRRECSHSHYLCRLVCQRLGRPLRSEHHEVFSEPPPLLPSRVVEIGSDQDSIVRLYERELNPSGPHSAHYVAFSYCWGVKEQSHQTSQANLASSRDSIPFDRLELSVQHAIRCARQLKLQYLWVDCLCIVQDDPEDKTRCISQLKDIFQNATITIIAETASSVRSGFLLPNSLPQSFTFPFHVGDRPVSSITLVPMTDRNDHDRKGTGGRAWCLEEFLLSRRKLIYGEHDIRWSCLAATDKHFGPGHIRHSATLKPLPATTWAPPKKLDPTLALLHAQSRLWNGYVEEYSHRTLTHQDDASRAIAGVGEKLADALGDVYLRKLGVFKNMVRCGTMHIWAVEEPQEQRVSLVPTWSWLSIRHGSGITFGNIFPFDDQFEVVLDPSKDGVLDIFAAVIEVADLPKMEQTQIEVRWDTRGTHENRMACFILCFNYSRRMDYSGLVIESVGDGRWNRTGYFHRDWTAPAPSVESATIGDSESTGAKTRPTITAARKWISLV